MQRQLYPELPLTITSGRIHGCSAGIGTAAAAVAHSIDRLHRRQPLMQRQLYPELPLTITSGQIHGCSASIGTAAAAVDLCQQLS